MNESPVSFKDNLAPHTAALVDSVLALWPEHEKYLRVSFKDRSSELLDTTENIASLLHTVCAAQGLSFSDYAKSYRYYIENIIYPEEIYFHREGCYRLKTFKEAAAEVYNNEFVMSNYMKGLFVSDSLWYNHSSAMNDFAKTYLPQTKQGGRHLEIGPGHGMLLHLALRYGQFGSLSAWDVSPSSIAHTRQVLEILGESHLVDLHARDLYAREAYAGEEGTYDTIVFSEVLEHLEQPLEALQIIRSLLSPEGTVWINVPANGPSTDHLFLLRSPQEVRELAAVAGLEVIREEAFPIAGYSLERAIRQGLPITCILTARSAR